MLRNMQIEKPRKYLGFLSWTKKSNNIKLLLKYKSREKGDKR